MTLVISSGDTAVVVGVDVFDAGGAAVVVLNLAMTATTARRIHKDVAIIRLLWIYLSLFV